MPKANEIANELRRIADALDREPETVLHQPMLSFYNDNKEEFLASARLLPRPLKKEVTERRYSLETDSRATVWLRSLCDREKVCVLVKAAVPAVYECPPLLSEQEEAELGVEG